MRRCLVISSRNGRVLNPQDRGLNRTMERRGGARWRFLPRLERNGVIGKQINRPDPFKMDRRGCMAGSGRGVGPKLEKRIACPTNRFICP